MSTIYIVDNTNGELNITLKPGALDGPGSPQRTSDLRLYGMGALLWGEGMDENILRLAETFAVDSKVLNDYNPATGNFDYDPATDPILPKDENDIGPGYGITVPLNGQQWFNDTLKSVYVYNKPDPNIDAGTWDSISSAEVGLTTPLDPILGMTWFDLNASVCGQAELKIYNPSHPDAVDGFIGVAADYVSSCGDDMSGELSMSVDGGTTKYKIINVEDPINPQDVVTLNYLDTVTGTNLSTHIADDTVHTTGEQNSFLDTLSSNCMAAGGSGANMGLDLCALFGWTSSAGDVWTEVQSKISNTGGALVSGFISLTAAAPTDDLHAVSRGWVNDQIGNIPAPSASIPSGTIMLFAQATTPTGWTRVTSHDNKMLRVVDTGGGGGGGTMDPTFNDKVASHTHTGTADSAGGHYHFIHNSSLYDAGGSYLSTYDNGLGWHLRSSTVANYGRSNTSGAHTHNVTVPINNGAQTWFPRYLDIALASKD